MTLVPYHRTAIGALVVTAWIVSAAAAAGQTPCDCPPEPPGTWTGTAGLGVSLTSGNSDTMTFNLAFDVTRDPKTRHVQKWTGLYLRGEQDDSLIVNRTSLGFRHQYAFSGRVFAFGQIDYLRDTFKLIDYLVAPTAGVGYKVIDTEPTKFSVDAGAGIVWEKNPDVDVTTSPAVTAGEALVHQLTETTSLRHATTALWKADDFGDGLYSFSVGIGTRISEHLQLSVDVLDTFKNKPPTAATEKNDVALVTAVTAKF
jgi:putative salt-induced outer membrane protein YdiY